MFADKHYPENLNLWELDQYLEKGWYRMGQVIFTTHFLFFGSNVYSALWIRLPLLNYQFKGTNRKLLNKITSQFNIIVRPAEINDEKDKFGNDASIQTNFKDATKEEKIYFGNLKVSEQKAPEPLQENSSDIPSEEDLPF